MFKVPDNNDCLKVLAIDPGSHNAGFARYTLDFTTLEITVLGAHTAELSNTDTRYNLVRELNSPRIARLEMLQDILINELDDFEPHIVVAESNYLGRFADAFATLIECVTVIRNTLKNYNDRLPLIMVGPSEAKKAVGVVGRKTEKKDVTIALKKLEDIKLLVDLDSLDEHSIDAIAIGYTVVKIIKDSQ